MVSFAPRGRSCYDHPMRIVASSLVAWSLSLGMLACSGPTKKPEGAIVETGSDAPENCCCKWTPQVSEDGKAQFESGTNRMECSSRHGDCVDDVQCAGAPQAEKTPEAPPPPTDESAPAVEP